MTCSWKLVCAQVQGLATQPEPVNETKLPLKPAAQRGEAVFAPIHE